MRKQHFDPDSLAWFFTHIQSPADQPQKLKYRSGTTKHLLKRAVLQSGLLPKSVVHRQKKGFGIPVARWLRVELHDYFRQALIEEWPPELAMFNRHEVLRLWNVHQRRSANHYKELWALFMLARWTTRRLDDPAPPVRQRRPLRLPPAP